MTYVSCWVALAAALAPYTRDSVKVAIVNVPVVSEKYQKTSDLEAKFDGIRRKLGQERDALRDKVDRLKRSLQEELKPGTDDYLARRKELALLEAELQWFVESEGQKVDRGLGESLREIFGDIQGAVREVAQKQGIDIVIASDQLPETPPDSATQVRQQILLQKVLFWDPRVDITDDVVARLNEQYRASLAAPPPDPAIAPNRAPTTKPASPK